MSLSREFIYCRVLRLSLYYCQISVSVSFALALALAFALAVVLPLKFCVFFMCVFHVCLSCVCRQISVSVCVFACRRCVCAFAVFLQLKFFECVVCACLFCRQISVSVSCVFDAVICR